MSGDRRRDRPKPEARSRSASLQRRSSQGDVIASSDRNLVPDDESELPTRPRGRTIADSEAPAEPLARVSVPPYRAMQDSIHPVRVPARTVRPPVSLWKRMWGTTAVVIVVAGGAVGIVGSLRARTLAAGRDTRGDGSPADLAAQSASERGVAAMEPVHGAVAPSAAPGLAAPPPLPAPFASRNAAAPILAVVAPPVGSSPGHAPARSSASAVGFRTPESLAAWPPVAPSNAPSLPRRSKPLDETAAPLPLETEPPPQAPALMPAPAPAASDPPDAKGESEAWVTEERRF